MLAFADRLILLPVVALLACNQNQKYSVLCVTLLLHSPSALSIPVQGQMLEVYAVSQCAVSTGAATLTG